MPIIFGDSITSADCLDENKFYTLFLYSKRTNKILTTLENLTLQDLMTEIITISKSKDIANYKVDIQNTNQKTYKD